jgi:hypothetical protein
MKYFCLFVSVWLRCQNAADFLQLKNFLDDFEIFNFLEIDFEVSQKNLLLDWHLLVEFR